MRLIFAVAAALVLFLSAAEALNSWDKQGVRIGAGIYQVPWDESLD
jgi:hypothetical protein